jgi:hypothetical protein
MAELNFLLMANKQTINARTTPPTIPNIMGNAFEEERFDVVAEFPFAGGVWASTVGGFASEKVEDGGGGGLVLLPPVLLPPVPVSKNGYISYRTVQLPNSA